MSTRARRLTPGVAEHDTANVQRPRSPSSSFHSSAGIIRESA